MTQKISQFLSNASGLTKSLLGLFAFLQLLLQNDEVKKFIANAITVAMHAHPKLSVFVGSITGILFLVHNPVAPKS